MQGVVSGSASGQLMIWRPCSAVDLARLNHGSCVDEIIALPATVNNEHEVQYKMNEDIKVWLTKGIIEKLVYSNGHVSVWHRTCQRLSVSTGGIDFIFIAIWTLNLLVILCIVSFMIGYQGVLEIQWYFITKCPRLACNLCKGCKIKHTKHVFSPAQPMSPCWLQDGPQGPTRILVENIINNSSTLPSPTGTTVCIKWINRYT